MNVGPTSERYVKRGAGREKEREIEPVNHFFHDPLLLTFGMFEIIEFGCQTFEMSMSWIFLSQISHVSIYRNLPSLNSGLETEETWKLKLKLSQLS